MFFIKSQPIGTEACACLDMIQVGGKKRKSRGHRATRDFVREFAPPYEVSAGDGGAMLRIPTESVSCQASRLYLHLALHHATQFDYIASGNTHIRTQFVRLGLMRVRVNHRQKKRKAGLLSCFLSVVKQTLQYPNCLLLPQARHLWERLQVHF